MAKKFQVIVVDLSWRECWEEQDDRWANTRMTLCLKKGKCSAFYLMISWRKALWPYMRYQKLSRMSINWVLVLCRYPWWRHWSSVTYDRKDLQATAHAANQTSWMHSTHSRPQSKGFQVGMLCIVRLALSRIFEAWFICTSFGSSLQKHVYLKITPYTAFHNANILVKITIQGTICNVTIFV